jgi:membrane protease YdiL (CAAX protease family)
MDSLSQTGASSSQEDIASVQPSPELPAVASHAQPTQATQAAPTHTIDWLMRLVLFGAFILLIVRQIDPSDPNDLVYPLLIFGALAAGYLLASVPVVAAQLHRMAEEQPLGMALLPLVLLMPVIVQARATPDSDPTDVLFTGILIVLPVACAILNTPQFRRNDVPLGLITVVLPMLLPFVRTAASNDILPAFDPSSVALRVGAVALPILLVLFTTHEQRQRLNFLFICAVLSLWYAVEFDAFPSVIISPNMDVTLFQVAVIPLFLYVVAVAGRFHALGFAFQPTPRSVSIASTNFALLGVLAVPIGLVSGVLTPQFANPTPLEGIVQALILFLLIALPEELLFRGTLLTYLHDTLHVPVTLAIGIVSMLYGVAHVNNPEGLLAGANGLIWLIVIATLAGVFYARTFLAARNVTASAVVHAAVNLAWWVFFK